MKKDILERVYRVGRIFLLLSLCWSFAGQLFGQEQVVDSSTILTDTDLVDSLVREIPMLDTLPSTATRSDSDSLRTLTSREIQWSDTSVYLLLQRLEQLSTTLNEVNRIIRQGFDTTRMSVRLPKMTNDLAAIQDNLDSYGQRLNLRNLNAMMVVLIEMERQLSKWEKDLLDYYKVLIESSNRIESFKNDPTFLRLPSDTALLVLYIQQLRDLSTKWEEVITKQREGLVQIGLLHNRVTSLNIQVTTLSEEVSTRIKNFDEKILHRGYPPIWETPETSTQKDIVMVTKLSGSDLVGVLGYFFASSWWLRIFNVGLIIFMFFLIRNGQKHLKNNPNREEILGQLKYLHQHPFIAALVIGLTTAPFLYANPPLFYIELLWGTQVILLTILIWNRVNPTEKSIWLVLLAVFFIYGGFNLLVDTTTEERWVILFLGVITTIAGAALLRYANSGPDLFPPVMHFIIGLFFTLSAASVVLNILGWFMLSKMLGSAGLFAIFYAINLWVFIDMIVELIFLQSQVYKDNSQVTSWIDFQDFQRRIRKGLTYLAIFLWLVSFSRNLNFYEFFYEGIVNFLETERSIGSATFTFGSLLVFGLIIWITTLISRVISYFFGTADQVMTSGKKNRLGNYMLIFRLLILTVGFFLALSAAGIPLDKVAIVVGALGVGIGFGLQNIVNNLVSGIILAFERPIRIGDIIELGARVGSVKEIGIRSSKIATFEGADLIIPNGDLISQQLVNWTLTNNNRRIELVVGVGYGSDPEKVTEVINKVLKEQPSVMVNPAPMILMNDLGNSSVDFRILFWTFDFNNWIKIKSDVLSTIYQELKAADIEIPFPKRDVFVHLPDDNLKSKIKSMTEPSATTSSDTVEDGEGDA